MTTATKTTDLIVGQQLNRVHKLMLANREKMLAALPRHITPDRMIRVALNCLRKTPKLLECTPASLLGAISEAATYGWELGGVLGHAYLVPFGNEAVMIPGYKGLLDLCHRSGQIADVQPPQIVRDGDEFDFATGDAPFIKHKPARDPQRSQRPITYAYWVVNLRSGGRVRLVRSIEEIRAHRDKYSQAYKRAEQYRVSCESRGQTPDPQRLSAWHTAEEVMCGKTLIKECIGRGLIPMSSEFRTIAGREQQLEERAAAESIDVTGVSFADDGPLDVSAAMSADRQDRRDVGADDQAHPGLPDADDDEALDAADTFDQQEGSSIPPAPVSAAKGRFEQLLADLRTELEATDEILVCEKIADRYLDRCTNNAESLAIASAVTRRQDAIRQSRGGRDKASNLF